MIFYLLGRELLKKLNNKNIGDIKMIKNLLKYFLVGLYLIFASNCGTNTSNKRKTKLVVLIAVDGLGENMINHYSSVFQGGFLRLKEKGMVFDSAFVEHGITVSHAGHVTLSTGNYPSHHGIVDAAFYVPSGNTRVLEDAVTDSTEKIIGEENSIGVSPRKILTPGLGEWIKDSDSNSRSLSVGSGYISSLLYSSSPGDVFWYSRSSGRYVTSSFYRKDYPDWITGFNNDSLISYKNSSKIWNCVVPQAIRSLARKDKSKYEADGINTYFPHLYEKELAESIPKNKDIINTWFAWTPSADAATLALAKTGIIAKKLGQRNSTDYLSIVLSQIDNVCHYYGPNSLEALDTILRLDKELEKFFNFLDRTVGVDNYVLALSADHGFPEIPEYRIEAGKKGKRITESEIEGLLTNIKNVIGNNSVFSKVTAQKVVESLKKYDFVADAYLPEELLNNNETNDKFIRLYKNSYRKDRVPRLPLFSLNTFKSEIGKTGVMLRLKVGSIINLDIDNHGSPYDYDRHVPIYFYGSGVKPGNSQKCVATIDVAPTLAELAGIQIARSIDGKPLIKRSN